MYIHPELAYAIEWNAERNCLQRKRGIPMREEHKTKNDELFWFMNRIPGKFEQLDHHKWTPAEDFLRCYHLYNDEQVCICSQDDCKEMFFYTHIASGITVRLGSQCRLKMNPKEREILEKIKRDSKKENCKRAECSNKIDKRTTEGKEKFCSLNCEREEREQNKSEKQKEMDKKEEKERIEYGERKRKEKIEKDEKRERERIEYEERKRIEKIEKVGNWTIKFGIYKGKNMTFNEVFEKDKDYLIRLYGNWKELDERIADWIAYKWSVYMETGKS